MSKHLLIVVGNNWAEFTGTQARQLYIDHTGSRRGPVFNARTRRWVTVPSTARDLAVAAELRGYDVTVQAAETPASPVAVVTPEPAPERESGGLW